MKMAKCNPRNMEAKANNLALLLFRVLSSDEKPKTAKISTNDKVIIALKNINDVTPLRYVLKTLFTQIPAK